MLIKHQVVNINPPQIDINLKQQTLQIMSGC